MAKGARRREAGTAYRLGAAGRYSGFGPVSEEDDALLLFMEAIEAVHPEVIQDLKAEVCPLYNAFADSVEALPRFPPTLPSEPLPEETRYHESLQEWQKRFSLDRWADGGTRRVKQPRGPWQASYLTPASRFHRFVEAVLAFWRNFGGDPSAHLPSAGGRYAPTESTDRLWDLSRISLEQARWAQLLRAVMDKERWIREQLRLPAPGISEYHEAVRSLSLPGFNPLLSSQSRTEYFQEARRQLEEYVERVEKAAENLGGRPAAEKYNLEHFKWLALRQTKGMSPSEIAATFTRGRVPQLTVRNALNSTAALIGILLVEVMPGPKPERPEASY
jgi:hypothetical protein